MKVLARAALGLALLGGVAVAQPTPASAQGGGQAGGASELVLICKEFAGDLGLTTGECVSLSATTFNPGQAEGVALCKLFINLFDLPQQLMGRCVRVTQGGQGGL